MTQTKSSPTVSTSSPPGKLVVDGPGSARATPPQFHAVSLLAIPFGTVGGSLLAYAAGGLFAAAITATVFSVGVGLATLLLPGLLARRRQRALEALPKARALPPDTE